LAYFSPFWYIVSLKNLATLLPTERREKAEAVFFVGEIQSIQKKLRRPFWRMQTI
jgi:hypothetical protein